MSKSNLTQKIGRVGQKQKPKPKKQNKLRAVLPRKWEQKIPFIDKKQIVCHAGQGGRGSFAFVHTRQTPRGPPNGGNGGKGGDVVIQANKEEQTLVSVLKEKYAAENGSSGHGHDQKGKVGRDAIIQVPLGTVVREKIVKQKQDGSKEEEYKYICDLDEDQACVIVAKGGKGGTGNSSFPSQHRGIQKADFLPGQPGETKVIDLELKTIADIGLVGFPNAGKSSFLAAVSKARPKIASYPFTTLHPILGVVEFDDYTQMKIADLPGIIEGAHENKGLGYQFLRHIERTHIICIMVDVGGRKDPFHDFEVLMDELKRYKAVMCEKVSVVLANKIDLERGVYNLSVFEEKLEKYKKEWMLQGKLQMFPISAQKGLNLHAPLLTIKKELEKITHRRKLIQQHLISSASAGSLDVSQILKL